MFSDASGANWQQEILRRYQTDRLKTAALSNMRGRMFLPSNTSRVVCKMFRKHARDLCVILYHALTAFSNWILFSHA